MTTTTSSSNSRSRPSGRLFDHQFFELYRIVVKQNLIPMGMYLVALLLTAVLPDYSSASQVDMSIVTPNSLHPRVSSFAFCTLGFVVPVLLAAMLFHYLHTRLSVDFYHGMPISRDRLFFTRYFAGCCPCPFSWLSIILSFLQSPCCPSISRIFCFGLSCTAPFSPSPAWWQSPPRIPSRASSIPLPSMAPVR